ncbi:MAG: hypothetical protein Q8865_04995, partial [Bacillota bacterium]|nr:hypothetical protein [Bacillota bacterium]
YLSIIRDLYDNSIVAHKTGTEQTINLVLNTIQVAKEKESVTAELQLHSDQGFQYTLSRSLRLFFPKLALCKSDNCNILKLLNDGGIFSDVAVLVTCKKFLSR